MEHAVILPWVEEETTQVEFYVPDYIEKMADDVLLHYDLKVSSRVVVTTKSDKGGAIWKCETDKGPKSLKLLHRRPARSMFSLGAQEYLVKEKQAKVPPIVPTREGANYVELGGKLWFVAEWIESLVPVTKDLEGAKHLCRALGTFHALTKGYVPPPQAEVATRLHKWPQTYQKIVNKMEWFRSIAKAYENLPASALLLQVVGTFEAQAKQSLERLQQSQYPDLIKHGNAYWGLVHQDYGWSNGQMGADGMWIIDLDGVAYDLPIRDLTKLITGTMADLFVWDVEWIRGMIQAYHEANPISPELYEIIMIELSLPNGFYKNIKEVVYEPELFLNDPTTEALIQSIIDNDQTKWAALAEVQDDWKGVTP